MKNDADIVTDIEDDIRRLKNRVGDLENAPAGASTMCAVHHSVPGSPPGGNGTFTLIDDSPATNIRTIPFDMVALNEGGYTIDTAFNGGTVGTAIKVPTDGWYQAGLCGRFSFSCWESLSHAPATDEAHIAAIEWDLFIDIDGGSKQRMIPQLLDIQLIEFGGSWLQLKSFYQDIQIVSPPVRLSADDAVWNDLLVPGINNSQPHNVRSLDISASDNPENVSDAVTLWVASV